MIHVFSVLSFVAVWLVLGALGWVTWKAIRRIEQGPTDGGDFMQGL